MMNKIPYEHIPTEMVDEIRLLIRIHLSSCGVDMNDQETDLRFTLGMTGLAKDIACRIIDKHEDNIRYKRYKKIFTQLKKKKK